MIQIPVPNSVHAKFGLANVPMFDGRRIENSCHDIFASCGEPASRPYPQPGALYKRVAICLRRQTATLFVECFVNREDAMFRWITIVTALWIICTVVPANAATYCASYVGGPERAHSRSVCHFATLADCRASVRERGGGHCYKKAQMR